MSLLPSDVLPIGRSIFEQNMPETASVQRVGSDPNVPDDTGAEGTVINIIESAMPCRVEEGNGQFERMIAERLNAIRVWNIFYPVRYELKEKDTLTIGDQTFQIAVIRGRPRSDALQNKAVAVITE